MKLARTSVCKCVFDVEIYTKKCSSQFSFYFIKIFCMYYLFPHSPSTTFELVQVQSYFQSFVHQKDFELFLGQESQHSFLLLLSLNAQLPHIMFKPFFVYFLPRLEMLDSIILLLKLRLQILECCSHSFNLVHIRKSAS